MANWTLGQVGKTKPIQSQFKANTNPIQSQYKPNSNPSSEKSKMNVSNVITKNYANKSQFEPKAKQIQSKPIKPNIPNPNNHVKKHVWPPEQKIQKKLNIFQKILAKENQIIHNVLRVLVQLYR